MKCEECNAEKESLNTINRDGKVRKICGPCMIKIGSF